MNRTHAKRELGRRLWKVLGDDLDVLEAFVRLLEQLGRRRDSKQKKGK